LRYKDESFIPSGFYNIIEIIYIILTSNQNKNTCQRSVLVNSFKEWSAGNFLTHLLSNGSMVPGKLPAIGIPSPFLAMGDPCSVVLLFRA